MKAWIIILAVVGMFGMYLMNSYNGMVAQEQAVNQTWAQVETQYQRRFDLIPNLQAAVEGAANFEKSTFTAVTEARTKWMAGQTINDKVAAANDFNSALSRLLVTVESYPQLKATQQFADFMVSLEGTENRVAVARKDFNDTATVFNITIKSFPTNLLAGFFGFSEKALFKSSQDAANAPKVKFGN